MRQEAQGRKPKTKIPKQDPPCIPPFRRGGDRGGSDAADPEALTHPRSFQAVRRGWRWWIVIVVAGLIVAGSLYAIWNFAPSDPERFRIAFAHIEHPPLPACAPPAFLTEVAALGQFPEQVDTRDADLLPRLEKAFRLHPWIEQVARVKRHGPEGLSVDLRFRIPVAIVEVEPGIDGQSAKITPPSSSRFEATRIYLVDANGFYLPTETASAVLRGSFLTITGAAGPPRGAGLPWGEKAVEAAVRLAGFVAPDRENLAVAGIEIARDPLQTEHLHLRLRTQGGTHVVWGQITGEQRHAEPAPEQRLAYLKAYRRQHGSLDRPSGPYLFFFDLRSADGMIRVQRAP